MPEIRDALGRYGIAIGVMAPPEAAARVQGRPEPVRRNLVAALDECLGSRRRQTRRRGNGCSPCWMPPTTTPGGCGARSRAEGDRKARRAAGPRGGRRERNRPASSSSWPIASPVQSGSTRLEFLRRIQHAYPADLWANHELAWELNETGQPAEAVRYFTAALALRPG